MTKISRLTRGGAKPARENALGEFGFLDRKLTLGERFALAFTVKSIHGLPDFLQQYSDACDMLDLLEGKDCRRGGYILGKALTHFQSISGFQPDGLDKEFEPRFQFMPEACEKFIAEATAAGVAYVEAMEAKVEDENGHTGGIPLTAILRGPRTPKAA
jgi:hypothetical protein